LTIAYTADGQTKTVTARQSSASNDQVTKYEVARPLPRWSKPI
jgi:hypothetical protein